MDAASRLVGGGMSRYSKVPEDVLKSVELETEPATNGSVSITSITDITDVLKELPTANAFPVSALPKACATLTKEAAAAIGCPPDLVGTPMLPVLSGAVGNARVIKLKEGWTEGAAMYTTVVAEPGEKKTPAEKVATEPRTESRPSSGRRTASSLTSTSASCASMR